jgi:hypothetical protein
VPEDRAGPHDRDVEPGLGGVAAQLLRFELGPAVGLEGPARRLLGHGVRLGNTEDGARRRMDDLGHALVTSRQQHVGCAGHVHRLEQGAVLGQRHLCDVVEHDVDALARGRDRAAVTHVAGDVLHPRRPGPAGLVARRRVEVEDPDVVASLEGQTREDRAEVAAPPGDQHATHQIGAPCSRHQRMLARMPSSRPTAGS